MLLLTLFKITTASRASTLIRSLPMGRPGCPTKKRNWWESPCKPKRFELSPSVEYHPHQNIESTCPLITDHILEKTILIAFRQILSKILVRHAFSVSQSWLICKNWLEIKSSRIISQNYSPLSPLTFMGNPGDGGNPTKQPKMYSFTQPEKFSLWNLLLLSKVSFLPYEIVIFM